MHMYRCSVMVLSDVNAVFLQVSTGGRSPPLSSLFSHRTLDTEDDQGLESEARQIPELDGMKFM